MSEKEIEEKIDEQITLCKYAYNKMYELPKKSNLKQFSKEVGFDGLSLKDAAFIAADALFEADKFDKGYINSAAIFISYEETKFFDSNDNVFLYVNEIGNIELVTTWAEENVEVELYKSFAFDSLDTKYIQQQANDVLLEASNRFKAIRTPSLNNVKVMLTGEYVKRYFNHFAYKLSNDAIYANESNYAYNQSIQSGNKCDLITMRFESTLKGSTLGRPFDDEGIALKRLNLYEKGVVKNFYGSNAISQYLDKPVNGNYKNLIVNAGTLQKEDLNEENYLEIMSLSDFDIDTVTGDFASEIRLACLHLKNKNKQYVTGGSISGNVYESLNVVRFSNETNQINNFVGPSKVLLDYVKIGSGE